MSVKNVVLWYHPEMDERDERHILINQIYLQKRDRTLPGLFFVAIVIIPDETQAGTSSKRKKVSLWRKASTRNG